MAGGQGSSFLILLTSPLDTVEGVQEVSHADEAPILVDDASLLSSYFPDIEDGTSAVLLDAKAASLVEDWANRHKAIYSLRVASISAQHANEIIQSLNKMEWPCWIFLYGALPSREQLARVLLASPPELQIRPAMLRGYLLQEIQGRQVVTPSACASQPHSSTPIRTTPKLRPAPDVLNRLRHDLQVDQADYQVVYEDRFDGEISLDLEQWKTDVSDEEFIPMHRILKFKRKWDDVVVWNRASRIDLVFGGQEHPCVEGIAVEVMTMDQGRRLLADAPELTRMSPCMLEFTDSQGGARKGWTFR